MVATAVKSKPITTPKEAVAYAKDRVIGGIALSATMMEFVPKHYMGRVQNLFSIFAIAMQIAVAPLVGGVAGA